MPMFNKIRPQEPSPCSSRFPEPKPKFYGVSRNGDSILDVELNRHLVDPRVKFESTQPLDLVASGVKFSDIKIQPTLEDAHNALMLVRKIASDAQFRAEIEASFSAVRSPESQNVSNNNSQNESNPE